MSGSKMYILNTCMKRIINQGRFLIASENGVRLIVTGLTVSNHCSDPDHSVTEEWIKIV